MSYSGVAVSRPLYDLLLLCCVYSSIDRCVSWCTAMVQISRLYGVSLGVPCFLCGQVLKLGLRGRIYAGCYCTVQLYLLVGAIPVEPLSQLLWSGATGSSACETSAWY